MTARFDVSTLTARQQQIMNQVDQERARLHADEVNSKFQTEPDPDHKRYYNTTLTKEQKDREKLVDDGEQLDVHISDSEYVSLTHRKDLARTRVMMSTST